MAGPGPYSGTSTLALVARVSAFSVGLLYGSLKLSYLKGIIRDITSYYESFLVKEKCGCNSKRKAKSPTKAAGKESH